MRNTWRVLSVVPAPERRADLHRHEDELYRQRVGQHLPPQRQRQWVEPGEKVQRAALGTLHDEMAA